MINFGSIFGKSPFSPLQKHMEQAYAAVLPLKPFFEALHKGDSVAMQEHRDCVFKAEEAADVIKNEVRDHLPRSMFMPIDRRDLLDVIDMQDYIADTAQDIVALLDTRKMVLPVEAQDLLMEFININEKVCRLGCDISHYLGTIFESGFGTHHVHELHEMIDDLLKQEEIADDMEMELNKMLFKFEDQMKPVDVIFWYEIIEWIGDLADYTKKVGNRIRLMIAHT